MPVSRLGSGGRALALRSGPREGGRPPGEPRGRRETGEEKTILMLMSGHGLLDMAAYEALLDGKLRPFQLPQKTIDENLGRLKRLYPFA